MGSLRCGSLVVITMLACVGVVRCEPYQVLWSADFNDYELGDLPSQDPTWTQSDTAGEPGVVTIRATSPFTPADYGLGVWKSTPAGGGYQLCYAVKDLAGAMAATDSQRIAFEFDTWIYSRSSQVRQQETGYRLQDPCGVDIVYLMTRNTTVAGVYQLNGVDIPPPRWIYGYNHYKMVLDFDAGMVDLYIDHALTPRVSAPLYGEGQFTSADIAMLRLDAGLYHPNHLRSITNNVDNIVIWDARDWDCPQSDVSGDCRVDLADFSIMAHNWLKFDIDPNALESSAP